MSSSLREESDDSFRVLLRDNFLTLFSSYVKHIELPKWSISYFIFLNVFIYECRKGVKCWHLLLSRSVRQNYFTLTDVSKSSFSGFCLVSLDSFFC